MASYITSLLLASCHSETAFRLAQEIPTLILGTGLNTTIQASPITYVHIAKECKRSYQQNAQNCKYSKP